MQGRLEEMQKTGVLQLSVPMQTSGPSATVPTPVEPPGKVTLTSLSTAGENSEAAVMSFLAGFQ